MGEGGHRPSHIIATMEPAAQLPAAVLVMGVSGAGKTLLGRGLADRLGWIFRDGDDVHPPVNVAKMRRGLPLDDADRGPWLDALALMLATAVSHGPQTVLACSALRRRYRQRLGLPRQGVRLVHLAGSPELLRERVEQRAGHFMPAALLDSQLATLEPPDESEQPIVVDVAAAPAEIIARIMAALGLP